MLSLLQNSWLALILIAVGAYLIGSMNWAIILTRVFKKADIRQVGSGNAGATNVLRAYGPVLAAMTFIGDVGKGILSSLLGGWLITLLQVNPVADTAGLALVGRYAAGLFVVLGHMYPLFHRFKGGKGVAASAGLLFVLDWRAAIICLSVFIIAVGITRMVSLGSVIGVGIAPFVVFMLYRLADGMPVDYCVFFAAMILPIAVIVIWKHSGNICRIINGTESKLGEKATPKEEQINE